VILKIYLLLNNIGVRQQNTDLEDLEQFNIDIHVPQEQDQEEIPQDDIRDDIPSPDAANGSGQKVTRRTVTGKRTREYNLRKQKRVNYYDGPPSRNRHKASRIPSPPPPSPRTLPSLSSPPPRSPYTGFSDEEVYI